MRVEVLIAGRGGQGILLLGHILGAAIAKYTDLHVLGSEIYAAETRGGDSRVDLVVADREEEADFIKVAKADIALFMHQLQLDAYRDLVRDGATVFLDKSNITNIPQRNWRIYLEPYTDIAEREIGSSRVANIVALGHLVKITSIVTPEAIEKVIEEIVSREWIDLNIKAFRYFLVR
ncbi:MAG: 2-oxoacid:acceptor oxidoreductase family protein [Sulfolobales archaeon]|nr:2-oxoacid:acceptor oxidoreductase family protein [Sulfolobales archaeon]MDW8082555.1 2-oxoacid:acceptor oxidoreductase family protein [Sulfolobales archaeon]